MRMAAHQMTGLVTALQDAGKATVSMTGGCAFVDERVRATRRIQARMGKAKANAPIRQKEAA